MGKEFDIQQFPTAKDRVKTTPYSVLRGIADLFMRTYSGTPPLFERWERKKIDNFVKQLAKKGGVNFIISDGLDGKLAGAAIIELNPWWETIENAPQSVQALNPAFLREIIVDEKYRGQGLGKQLLETAIRLAQNEGKNLLFLQTDLRLPAIEFYFRNGFSPLGLPELEKPLKILMGIALKELDSSVFTELPLYYPFIRNLITKDYLIFQTQEERANYQRMIGYSPIARSRFGSIMAKLSQEDNFCSNLPSPIVVEKSLIPELRITTVLQMFEEAKITNPEKLISRLFDTNQNGQLLNILCGFISAKNRARFFDTLRKAGFTVNSGNFTTLTLDLKTAQQIAKEYDFILTTSDDDRFESLRNRSRRRKFLQQNGWQPSDSKRNLLLQPIPIVYLPPSQSKETSSKSQLLSLKEIYLGEDGYVFLDNLSPFLDPESYKVNDKLIARMTQCLKGRALVINGLTTAQEIVETLGSVLTDKNTLVVFEGKGGKFFSAQLQQLGVLPKNYTFFNKDQTFTAPNRTKWQTVAIIDDVIRSGNSMEETVHAVNENLKADQIILVTQISNSPRGNQQLSKLYQSYPAVVDTIVLSNNRSRVPINALSTLVVGAVDIQNGVSRSIPAIVLQEYIEKNLQSGKKGEFLGYLTELARLLDITKLQEIYQ